MLAARSSVVMRLVPPVIGVALLCAWASPSDMPPPKGWVQTSEPDEATLKCANVSRPDWMVGLRKGAVAVGDPGRSPPSTLIRASRCRFAYPEKLQPWGGVQVLKLSDGYFLLKAAMQ